MGDFVYILVVLGATFALGVFVDQKVFTHLNLSEECKKTKKKHRDITNWLKSELASVKKKKIGRHRIDQNKVKLLELIIKKLQK